MARCNELEFSPTTMKVGLKKLLQSGSLITLVRFQIENKRRRIKNK